MNEAEAAILLTAVSANDGREVTEPAARAWAAALPDVPLSLALEALPGYYRTATRGTRNWIYPGDVLDLARALVAKRRWDAIGTAHRQAVAAGVEPLAAMREAADAYDLANPHELPLAIERKDEPAW